MIDKITLSCYISVEGGDNVLDKEFYTAKELAKALKVTPMTIYRLARRGELKAVRIGRSIRFSSEDVEEFVENASLKTEMETEKKEQAFPEGAISESKLTDDKIEDFCRRWEVTELALFGSVLREDFGPDSDVDVLISFTRDAGWSLLDWIEMIEELKVIFGREVDLVERRALRNPFRRHAILPNREVIYRADRQPRVPDSAGSARIVNEGMVGPLGNNCLSALRNQRESGGSGI